MVEGEWAGEIIMTKEDKKEWLLIIGLSLFCTGLVVLLAFINSATIDRLK